MQGTVWIKSDKSVAVDPVCMEGEFAMADWDKPRLFYDKTTQPGLSRRSEEGRDKRVSTTKRKAHSKREGPTQTYNLPW